MNGGRRRLLVGGLLGCLLPVLCGAGEPPEVVVDFRDGCYYATLSQTVAVPPAVALEVLNDLGL